MHQSDCVKMLIVVSHIVYLPSTSQNNEDRERQCKYKESSDYIHEFLLNFEQIQSSPSTLCAAARYLQMRIVPPQLIQDEPIGYKNSHQWYELYHSSCEYDVVKVTNYGPFFCTNM